MMDARIRIAAAIWFVTMLLAVPAAFVMFLLVVSTVNLSGHGQVSTTPFLVVALVPPLVAALATHLMSAYAARASNQQVHAGPVVLACTAGSLFGFWLGSSAGAAAAVLSIASMSFAGAVAGTFVPLAIRPRTVGIALAVITELIVLVS